MVADCVGGGPRRGSRRHCIPPITLVPGPSIADTAESTSLVRGSTPRLLGRGVSCHEAHNAREEGEGLATESL